MDINLYHKKQNALTHDLRGLALPVLLCLVIGVGGYTWHHSNEIKLAEQRAALTALQTQITAASKTTAPVSATQTYQQVDAQLAQMKASRADWVNVLTGLGKQLPSGTMIQQIELQAPQVQIQGQVTTMASLARYEQSLLSESWVSAVNVSQLHEQSGPVQMNLAILGLGRPSSQSATSYSFQMTVTLKAGAGGNES